MKEEENLYDKEFEKEKENYDINIKKINQLVLNTGYNILIVNRLDYYGNSIPLGAFCNALSFILYGFQRANVFKSKDSFLLGIILLYGGLGQATAGILEFIKGRTFTSTLYISYGFYCLSHFAYYFLPLFFAKFGVLGINFDEPSLCAFYGCWLVISIPITIGSIKTNLFFVLQCIATSAFFVLRCFGEGFLRYGLMRQAAGILQIIAGFISLYICINQLVNEQFRKQFLPSVPLQKDNEIDIVQDFNE
jgi:succinate-acetate transporter protein